MTRDRRWTDCHSVLAVLMVVLLMIGTELPASRADEGEADATPQSDAELVRVGGAEIVRLYNLKDPEHVYWTIYYLGLPDLWVIPVGGRSKLPTLTTIEAALTGQLGGEELWRMTPRGTEDTEDDQAADGDETAEAGDHRPWKANEAISGEILEQVLALVATMGWHEAPPPSLVLVGQKESIDIAKRVIASLDVQHPEMRLDLWVFQLSGADASTVSEKTREAVTCIEATQRMLHAYVQRLEAYAIDRLREDAHRASAPPPAGRAWGVLPSDNAPDELLMVPSGRGEHPLALTETLAVLACAASEREPDGRMALARELEEEFSTWLGDVAEYDQEAIDTWRSIIGVGDVRSDASFDLWCLLFEATFTGPRSEPGTPVRALLPRRLLGQLADRRHAEVMSNALLNLGRAGRSEQLQVPDGRVITVPPANMNFLTADAGVVLKRLERALAADIDDLFMAPLLARLHAIAAEGNREGRGVASNTSLTVLSDQIGVVNSVSESYFELSKPATALTWEHASGSRASPPATGDGNGVGAAQAAPAPRVASDILQLADPLLGTISMGLESNDQVWEVVTDGSVIGFIPHVLRGGASAELEVELVVKRSDMRTWPPKSTPAHVPLNSVASHRARTRMYVDGMDLTALSSLALTTSHPRPDYQVPILSGLPLLGKMFRFSRGPQSVHHESVLMIRSTIVPTGYDLWELYDPVLGQQ